MAVLESTHAPAPLTLRQPPPAAVAQSLELRGIDPAALLLCTHTDIDRAGRYAAQWLCATAREVLVVAEADGSIQQDLTFEEAHEFRNEPVVGSGLLQVRLNGVFIDLLRYSNRYADRFEKVARKLEHHLRGEPIVIHPDEDAELNRKEGPVVVNRKAVLARMLPLMRPYRRSAIFMTLLLIVGVALDLVSPQLTRILVDEILPGTAQESAAIRADPSIFAQHVQALIYVVLFLAGVQVLRMLVNMANGQISTRVGTAITFDMRSRLVAHLQRLSVGYYDRQQVGSLVGRVAYDTEALHGFIQQITGGFVFQLLVVIGVGIMMFSIDAKLALFALLPAPLVMSTTVIFWKYVYPLYYRLWDASSKQAGMLSGMLSGIRVVKAFSQEARELNRFDTTSDMLRSSRRGLDGGMSYFNPAMGLVFQLGGWIVWYVGGKDVIGGELTLGELMAFFGYLWMFYGPLAMLTQFTNWLTQFATQAHRIFEVLDAPVSIPDPIKPVPMPHVTGEIEFTGVTFGYSRHTPVLRDIGFRIAPGEMIGIVGRSGSGKTTIINLICRYYDVDEGSVRIDGVDVRDIETSELRRQIGVVLQEPFLFRGSIFENLTYGNPDAAVEAVIRAAKASNCHDFIMKHAHAYDTWVGERGAGLSGGERQRISIGRVLLTDPAILILDEATSSVDAESEAAIQTAMAEVVRGRTTIAIAHRLSTLRSAHRIMVIDNGKLAEHGTHDDLLASGGIYANLVALQGQRDEDVFREAMSRQVSHEPRWLTPDNSRIHLGNRQALHVTVIDDRIYAGVYAVRCLPVHAPDKWISLRYVDAQRREIEIGILRAIDEWPEEPRRLIGESLAKRYFVHAITRVHEIEPLSGFLRFNVDTDLGPMEFLMRSQSDRAQDYRTSGKMLLDVDENRYLIPDVEALPDPDRRLFRRHIYW